MNTLKTTEPRPWVIYTLSDPRTPDTVRYVGITHGTLEDRLKTHIYLSRTGKLRTHTVYWIRSLLRDGVEPLIKVIDGGIGSGWEASEVGWIAWYKEQGSNLTNHTAGGEESVGRPNSPETRAKIRVAKLGKKLSPEHRAKIALAGLGRKPSPETRAKLSASKLGNNPSSEARAKISAAHLGRKHSPEARANMASAHLGKKRSAATCAKMSEALRESWKTRERLVSSESREKMSKSGKARCERTRQKKSEAPNG